MTLRCLLGGEVFSASAFLFFQFYDLFQSFGSKLFVILNMFVGFVIQRILNHAVIYSQIGSSMTAEVLRDNC